MRLCFRSGQRNQRFRVFILDRFNLSSRRQYTMMRRALLKQASFLHAHCRKTPLLLPPPPPQSQSLNPINPNLIPSTTTLPRFRFFSTENDDPNPNPTRETSSSLVQSTQENKDIRATVEDVSNKELKTQIESFFKGDDEALPTIFESILKRRLKGTHEHTDDELLDELQMKPVDGVRDDEFESDFEEMHETDSEIENLYDARDIVMKRMVKDEFFHMDDKKWEDMVKEGMEHGFLKENKECEEILEDMFMWEKLLPDDLKKKVEERYNEIADRVESGELKPEEGYEMYQEFEHELLMEHARQMEEEGPPKFDETSGPDKKKDVDDPPGEGPILRWQTRVVFAPGGDAWHPKNRKVKLAVTVKELGLSKHQFRRLRELVGKRYNPGKDELTITSERYEHREENRKDCLRTLFSLIEEAGKARLLVEDARTSHVKNRLKANSKFMEKLSAKIMRKEGSTLLHA